MSDNALVANPVEAYLEKFSGNYVAAYNQIVAEEDAKAIAARPPSNAEIRKAAYTKALHVMDRKEIAAMNKTVRNFLPLAKANADITAETGELSLVEAEDLMIEVLEVKRLAEIAKARYEAIRKRVFNSITETFAAAGEDFPDFVPGYIEIPQLGLKFTREGGGRKDPELDEDLLKSLVDPEVWERVTDVEHIPAQEVRSFNADLFLQEARKQPALLEKLRQSLVVGEFAPRKFNQRVLEPEEE